MGGGNSRSNAGEAVVVPPKIRPILIRRFEELKKRKGAAKLQVEGTLSKKQLLKEDTEEDDSTSQSSHETCRETKKENKVSTGETQQAKEETEARVMTPEKLSRVVPLPNSECEAEEEKDPNKGGNIEQDNKHSDHDDQEKIIQVEPKAKTKVKTEEKETTEPKQEIEQHADAKGDDDDDSDNDDSEEFSTFLPGSPSFRIYCIEAEKRQEEECEKQILAMHQKAPSIDTVETAASEAEDSGRVLPAAEVESTTKRKGNRTKKFGAVKNLFNVKSCYHPMCSCTGDERRHLIPAKAGN